MTPPLFTRCALTALSFVLCVATSHGQWSLRLGAIETIAGGGARANLTLLKPADAPDDSVRLSDFNVVDQNDPRDIISLLPAKQSSMVRTWGVAVSTTSHLDLAAAAIRRLTRFLAFPSHVAVTATMGSRPIIVQDLTYERKAFVASAERLTAADRTDLDDLLRDSTVGIMPIVARDTGRKVAIVIVDLAFADLTIDLNVLGQQATAGRITLYALVLGGDDRSGRIKSAVEKTGGKAYSNITTVVEAERAIETILHGTNGQSMTLTWGAGSGSCEETSTARVSIPRLGAMDSATYAMPTLYRRVVLSETPYLALSGYRRGQVVDTVVYLTTPSVPVTITAVRSSRAEIEVLSPTIFPIDVGLATATPARLPVRLRWIVQDHRRFEASVIVDVDECRFVPLTIECTPESPVEAESIRLTYPLGGERFGVADTIDITWEGVDSSTYVRLLWSGDAGATWSTIDSGVTGGRYRWVRKEGGPVGSVRVSVQVMSGWLGTGGTLQRVRPLVPFINRSGTLVIQAPVQGSKETMRANRLPSGELLRAYSDVHPVSSLVVSNREDRFWASTNSNWLYMSNVPTTLPSWFLMGTVPPLSCIALSADESELIVADGSKTVQIRSATDGAVLRSIAAQEPVRLCAVSSDNMFVVLTPLTAGRKIQLHAYVGGAKLGDLPSRAAPILGLSINPDGSVCCVAYADGILSLIDLKSHTFLRDAIRVASTMQSFDVDWGQSRVVVASGYQMLICDLLSGDRLATMASTSTVQKVSFRTDATQVVACDDSIIRVLAYSVRPFNADTSGRFEIFDERLSIENSVVDLGEDLPIDVTRPTTLRQQLCNRGVVPITIVDAFVDAAGARSMRVDQEIVNSQIEPGECVDLTMHVMPGSSGTTSAWVTVRTKAREYDSAFLCTYNAVDDSLTHVDIIDFGSAGMGTKRLRSARFVRAARAPASIDDLHVEGPYASSFLLLDSTAFTVDPGQVVDKLLEFRPERAGACNAMLTFTVDGTRRSIRLTGVGIGGWLTSSTDTVNMGVVGCAAAGKRSIGIVNEGNVPVRFYSARITRDSSSFDVTLSKGDPPFTLDPGEVLTANLVLADTSIGVHESTLELVAEAANVPTGSLTVSLRADRETLGIDVIPTELDIVNVVPGETALGSFLLVNRGSAPISWEPPVAIGNFTITSIIPMVTPPGGSSRATVLFNGGVDGRTYQSTHDFMLNSCGRSAVLTLRAVVARIGRSTVHLPDVSAAAGAFVTLPLRVGNADLLSVDGATGLRGQVSYDASSLIPVGSTPEGFEFGGMRVIDLTYDSIPKATDTLTLLQFKVNLARDTAVVVHLSGWEGVKGRVRVSTHDGNVSTRFAQGNYSDNPLVQVRVDFASLHGTVDVRVAMPTSMVVEFFDELGQRVAGARSVDISQPSQSVDVDLSPFPSGRYWCVVTTPTGSATASFAVMR